MVKSSEKLSLSPALLESGALVARFRQVRQRSESLAMPISCEDAQVQSMPDVSPTKWHLAHTSWFFETFLLRPHLPNYQPYDGNFHYLFNSYYEAEGPRHPRPARGMITRPSLERVFDYREWTTDRLASLLEELSSREDWPEIAALVELGCHHEEQHQELLLTDIKHVLAQNPFGPRYKEPYPKPLRSAPPLRWHRFEGGLVEIGHDGDGFAYDNEFPRHKRYVYPFALASRLVTNGEYHDFMEDGGYRDARLWLSDGWAWVEQGGRGAPLYWQRRDGDEWTVFTLYGRQPVHWEEPVCHLSLYEADAYARWAGARLPREDELELALEATELRPVNDLASGRLHPTVAEAGDAAGPAQLAGDVWEWTGSAYAPYPGYAAAPSAVGEYNGKFMCNQMVLKGGSCATPSGHCRATYRNFFPADAQWQFTGLRLAKDC